MHLAVTTSQAPSPAAEEEARAAALRHGLLFAARGQRPLAEVLAAAGADALLILTPRRAGLFLDGAARWWDPGMGALRLKRFEKGGDPTADTFLAAAEIRAGERILDCTLGLGADALVAAAAVGPSGRVVALESSGALAALVAEGLLRLTHPAARRIEVRAGDAAAALRTLPDRSFDLVCFDPMFRHGCAEPPGFALVRRLADARPLGAETLAAARRVARRAVLVKDGAPGWDLARLGLTPLPSARGAKRYYARLGPL